MALDLHETRRRVQRIWNHVLLGEGLPRAESKCDETLGSAWWRVEPGRTGGEISLVKGKWLADREKDADLAQHISERCLQLYERRATYRFQCPAGERFESLNQECVEGHGYLTSADATGVDGW
ncbi:hypothetical protein D7V93_27155 [Corallococcus llansteffanensis]|uniref:Uncharacterized protein n=1 Tax=Corallococcus llansteffanensis TaxID=2316731 RepID=A0A3A8PNH4_9BACT|nr:hypothetical protein D7V93_27155 [Corallococcus llansteffanensis]